MWGCFNLLFGEFKEVSQGSDPRQAPWGSRGAGRDVLGKPGRAATDEGNTAGAGPEQGEDNSANGTWQETGVM